MSSDLAGFGATAIGLIGTTIIAKETIKAVRQASRQSAPRRSGFPRRQRSKERMSKRIPRTITDEFNLRI